MIRNTVLLFINFAFLSTIITYNSWGINSGNEILQNDTNLHSIINLSENIFYDPMNKPIQFSDTGNYFIVIENRKKCDNCFQEINAFVESEKNNINANYVAVILTDSSSLERRRDYVHNKMLMPEFKYFYFQYFNSVSKSIFETLQTNYTPELILVNKGKIKHIPYRSIFDFPNAGFSKNTRKEIIEFLSK